jgi:hypothetical protein
MISFPYQHINRLGMPAQDLFCTIVRMGVNDDVLERKKGLAAAYAYDGSFNTIGGVIADCDEGNERSRRWAFSAPAVVVLS